MLKSKYIFITAFLFTYFILTSHQSLFAEGQTILKGTLIDEASGKGRGGNIQIKADNGAIMKLKADERTGQFEQVLDREKTYKVIADADDILRTEFDLDVKGEGNYFEQKETFKVKKLAPGAIISSHQIFKTGSSEFNANFESEFKEIMMTMRFNRTLYLDFKVSADQGKADKALTDARVEALKKQFETKMKPFIEKIKVSPDYNKSKENKDLYIAIEKIVNTLK